MIKRHLILLILLFVLQNENLTAQKSFNIIPLGIYGGSDESNLSAYMIAPANSNQYVCLDAGTLHAGIAKAIKTKALTGTAASILKDNIKGYLISHPHLDHVAGLIINSPDDAPKAIYGLPYCLDIIADKYFSWKSWANFGDEGEQPWIKKYHYQPLSTDSTIALSNTNMTVKPFELSHSTTSKSTAFLIGSNNAYVLYLGDTGADTIEHSTRLKELWQYIAPFIKTKQLKGIFIEASFPGSQAKDKLFGHLTPTLLMSEMKRLSALTGNAALIKFPVVITHIKPSGNNEAIIKKELQQYNSLQLQLIFPVQGKAILL